MLSTLPKAWESSEHYQHSGFLVMQILHKSKQQPQNSIKTKSYSNSYRTQNTGVGSCYGSCLTGGSSESCKNNEEQKCFSSVTRNSSDITTTACPSASSLVNTISVMHRQPLQKTKLLMKHSILIKPQ